MSRDPHHSIGIDIAARSAPTDPELHVPTAEEQLDEIKRAHDMRDNLLALELRLIHTDVKALKRTQEKILDCARDSAAVQVQTLEALRSIRDSVASSAQEGPQLLALILDATKQMRDSIAAIALVVLTSGTNGHAPEGETT